MKTLTKIMLFVPFLLSSCKKDESLSPPENSETVSVVVQLPQDIDVLPLGVMYRSNVCHQKRTKGNGEHYDEPGYHFIKYSLKKDSDSNVYRFPIPFNGGGECHWQLSNVTLDIQYKKDMFDEDIERTISSGLIFIFDDNSPQQYNGVYKHASGDLTIKKDYFPWINERFLNGHSRDIWMYGGGLYTNYKVKNTKSIFFSPTSHSGYIIHSLGVKVKSEGNSTQFTYPDGTIVSDGSSFPDYEKLMSLIKVTK